MSFRFKKREKLRVGLRRVMREQGEVILRSLSGNGKSKPAALHDSRRSIKRIRAVLRLIREKLPPKVFKEENRCYREMGRILSPARDAEVLAAALEKLREHCKKSERADLSAAKKVLARQQAAVLADFSSLRSRVEPALVGALRRVEKWPLRKLRCEDLLGGLQSTYKEGRILFQCALEPTDENLHEWRKRVKDLWYVLCLLKYLWPEVMKELIHEVKKLSEFLGDDHDLFMLEQALNFDGLGPGENLAKLIQKRRDQLQNAAFDLGSRLYAEKPKAFTARLESYRKAWSDGL